MDNFSANVVNLFFIVSMKDRTTQTLTRIIQKRIRHYNIIYSNSWKEPVKEINYVHQTVNQTLLILLILNLVYIRKILSGHDMIYVLLYDLVYERGHHVKII